MSGKLEFERSKSGAPPLRWHPGRGYCQLFAVALAAGVAAVVAACAGRAVASRGLCSCGGCALLVVQVGAALVCFAALRMVAGIVIAGMAHGVIAAIAHAFLGWIVPVMWHVGAGFET